MPDVRRFGFSAKSHLLDVDQVAAYLGLTRQAVYQRRYRGGFPAAVKIGSSLRWHPEEIAAWLQANRELSC